MTSRAARTRAYNKQFDAAKFLEPLGATRDVAGLWRLPSGRFIAAGPGRPGKVQLVLSSDPMNGADDWRRSSRVFGVNETEEMRAFAEGRPSKAEQRAALAKLAPEMLEALRAVWDARGAPAHIRLEALDRVAAVLDKAEGK